LALLFAAVVLAAGSGAFLVYPYAKAMEGDGTPHTHEGPHSPAEGSAVEVEIVIREGGYHVLKGGQPHRLGVSLVAGAATVLALRNEDTGSHEFISPLFTRTDIHFTGQAIGIFRKEAAGFRLNPGDTLILRFMAPFSDFPTMYDLIWCSRHGEHNPERKEMLIIVTEERPPRS
jgi:hypothetical protein